MPRSSGSRRSRRSRWIPQQRLFLQTAWTSIEDAGYAGADGKRRWGVFVGCASGEYASLLNDAGLGDSAHAFLGNSGSVLAARIAYLLDLTGPTMAIDTACSSSLVAVHLACEALRSGECEAAVAGGVALMLTPRMHVLTSKAGMLSPTGRSRAVRGRCQRHRARARAAAPSCSSGLTARWPTATGYTASSSAAASTATGEPTASPRRAQSRRRI